MALTASSRAHRSHNRATLEEASALLKLLSHPVRLSILCHLLHHGSMSVGALVLAERGVASQSQISQFLARMRTEDLVTCRKQGQMVYYRIKSPAISKIIKTLDKIYCKAGT